jgi:hypothetical protein
VLKTRNKPYTTRWQQAKKRTQIELSTEIKIGIKTQQLKNNTWENS